ncbi:protein-disulfide reductase DsbD domain-containing protein [Phreatobacter sp.]|uniref:protein-disulfide reductase DsbD domain-containing protein n=1 Tax=Phreatobacter sp. TaxID=1966341 RepID=UPI0025D29FB5|nr:protein-disulfide reductase DsbD domain-containing protein [Phreatobacter sp.]
MLDRRALLSALAVVGAAAPASANRAASASPSASPWSRDTKSAVRLVRGGLDGGVHRAGVEITLDPGTKTYWRTPGDSGVPPAFDWSGSDNLGDVAVDWPAPMRFSDGNGFSIGYQTSVIFPLRVQPRDPSRPVRLVLKLDYAVCDQICIPAKATATLALVQGSADPAVTAALAGFVARVPKLQAEGLALALEGVERGGDHPVLLLSAAVDAEAAADLFVEGPDSRWVLPLPEPTGSAGTERRFRLVMDGAPRGTEPLGHELTFTLVSGTRALEMRLTPPR